MNLERRIKRHIWSREHTFNIDVPIDLRPVCLQELADLGITAESETTESCRFSGKLDAAYTAHLHLRTAARIWLVLPAFSAGATEELFRKTAGTPWELYLSQSIPLQIKAVVRNSRIQHEGNAAATLLQGIERRFSDSGIASPAASGPEISPVQRIKLDIHKNRVEIQIDLSGEHLHRRGYRRLTGDAPIRENLAAGVLLWTLEQWRGKPGKKVYPGRIHDPFCGSGTFVAEAAMISIHRAVGSRRDFLFLQQPHYREQTFRYLLHQAEQQETASAFSISGSDISEDAVTLTRENCNAADLSPVVYRRDAFASDGFTEAGEPALIVTNPPYGERITGGEDLYRKLIGKMKTTGTSGTIIIPRNMNRGMPLKEKPPKIRLNNGGIPVFAVYITP